jgi:hypothetical protein
MNPAVQYLSALLGGPPASLAVLGGGGLGGGFGANKVWQSNSGSQGGASSASTPAQAGSTTSSSEALKADLEKLRTDLQAIAAKSQVTVAELTAVKGDFEKVSAAATSPPDSTKLVTLTSDITSLNGQLPTAAQATQLSNDYTAVLQSQGITDQSLVTQTISDIGAVVTSANITSTDVSTIATDEAAIKNDLGSSASSDSGGPDFGHAFPGGPIMVTAGGGPMRGGFGGGDWGGGPGMKFVRMGGMGMG